MKRKIKKIFFEVISNFKIFNIIFFLNEIANDQDFPKLTGGLDKGGRLDNVEYGNSARDHIESVKFSAFFAELKTNHQNESISEIWISNYEVSYYSVSLNVIIALIIIIKIEMQFYIMVH